MLIWPNVTFSQSDDYSISINKCQVKDLLIEFTELYNVSFSYPADLINNTEIRNITQNSNSLEDLISSSFESFGIKSRVGINNTFLLKQNLSEKYIRNKSLQSDQVITYKGKIIAKESPHGLAYVCVALPQTNEIVFTQEDGSFEIEINKAQGTEEIIMHLLGYETLKIPIKDIVNSQQTIFILQPRPFEINEVTILNSRPGRIIRSDKIELTSRFNQKSSSSLFGADIMRNIQMIAGIDASDDASTSIKIRGSNSDETMIILDGIPLFNTSHYYGILSSINASYVTEVDIYKNAQPIELGNKAAGVVYMKSNNQIPNQIEGTININFIVPAIQLTIPLNKNGLLNLSFRSNWSDLSNSNFNSIGNNSTIDLNVDRQTPNGKNFTRSSNPDFSFWDSHLKFLQNFGENHRIQLSIHGGNDAYINQVTNTLDQIQPNGDMIQEDIFTNIQNWDNYGFSALYDVTLSKTSSLISSAYHSRYETDFINQTSLRFSNTQISEDLNLNFDQFNKVSTSAFDTHLLVNLSTYKLTLGSQVKSHRTQFIYNLEGDPELLDDIDAQELTLYGEVNVQATNSLDISFGNRIHYYSETKKSYFSPQFSLQYTLNQNWSLKAHTGINYQFLREINIELPTSQNVNSWILTNETFPVLQSINSMLGFTYKKQNFFADAELFYKDMDGIVEFGSNNFNSEQNNNTPSTNSFTMYQGTGISKGIDMMFGYSNQNLDAQVSYTLSKTTYSIPEIFRGEEYNAQNDQRHQFKFNGTYRSGPWSISTSHIFSSGRPYLDREKVIELMDKDRKISNPNKLRSTLPDYFRIDLGLDYTFSIQNKKLTIGASIFNILDRNNVKYIQQIDRRQQNNLTENLILGSTSNLLQRTINFNASLSF